MVGVISTTLKRDLVDNVEENHGLRSLSAKSLLVPFGGKKQRGETQSKKWASSAPCGQVLLKGWSTQRKKGRADRGKRSFLRDGTRTWGPVGGHEDCLPSRGGKAGGGMEAIE